MTIEQQITAEALRQGVPPQIAIAVAQRESGLNPNIGTGTAGEIGLFQVKPTTAADMGVYNLNNLGENIRAGVSYLSWNFSRYGDWNTALMAYNGGPGNVDRGSISSDAANYAQQVLAWAGLSPMTAQPVVASVGLPSTPITTAGFFSDQDQLALLVVGAVIVLALVIDW